jgi:hypothetical protein
VIGEDHVRDVDDDHLQVLADLRSIAAVFGSDTRIASELGLDSGQVAAWRCGEAPPHEVRTFLARLAIVIREARAVFVGETLGAWLVTPQLELDDQTPINSLRKGRLTDVLLALQAAEHISFS